MALVFNKKIIGSVLLIAISPVLVQKAYAIDTQCSLTEQVKQAEGAGDYRALLQLLPKLDDSACTGSYIKSVSLKTTQLIGGAASGFLQKGEYEEASDLLKTAPELTWYISAMRGDIAANSKDWDLAAENFNTAFELAENPEMQEVLFQKSAEAMQLAGNLNSVVKRSGEGAGIFSTRGFKPRKVPVPIQFEFGKATFSNAGRANAEKLANYLKSGAESGEFKAINLTGHTDPKGSDQYNLQLSKDRARSLKTFLQDQRVSLPINTDGAGETTPPVLSNPGQYTEDEKHALARRVVLSIER